MSVVIGAGTNVSFSIGGCVVSANWGYNPNVQRLYCLGSWDPSFTYDKPTQTLSMVIYSGTGNVSFPVLPTTDCANANTVTASVSFVPCGDSSTLGTITGDWFVNSYGFSKDDANLPGQETWGMQQWMVGQYGNAPLPTYVIRGISEGQGTQSPYADGGLYFNGTTVQSEAGNVSAGGIGRNDILTIGTVESVGGTGAQIGLTGQGSASMPYTPLWI